MRENIQRLRAPAQRAAAPVNKSVESFHLQYVFPKCPGPKDITGKTFTAVVAFQSCFIVSWKSANVVSWASRQDFKPLLASPVSPALERSGEDTDRIVFQLRGALDCELKPPDGNFSFETQIWIQHRTPLKIWCWGSVTWKQWIQTKASASTQWMECLWRTIRSSTHVS